MTLRIWLKEKVHLFGVLGSFRELCRISQAGHVRAKGLSGKEEHTPFSHMHPLRTQINIQDYYIIIKI